MTTPSRVLRPTSHQNRAMAAGNMVLFRSLAEFRAMAPLPKDAQELIDEVVIGVGLDRLTFVADLISEGLTFPLANWLSVPELYWEKESQTGGAQRTMVPKTRGEGNLADREGTTIPIYLTMDNFDIGIRELLASERAGSPLDTGHIVQATRRVNEAIEDAGINGGPTVGGNSSPGLLTAPSANSIVYEGAGMAWDNVSKTGAEIVLDVQSMAATLRADRMFGPYNLYVNTAYGHKMNQNYSDGVTTFDMTIRKRLEQLEYGGRPLRIREVDQMAADRTSLIQMTPDVVDVVLGDEPMPVSWQDGPGWVFHHAVMACIVPRFKDTYDNQSGVCNGFTS